MELQLRCQKASNWLHEDPWPAQPPPEKISLRFYTSASHPPEGSSMKSKGHRLGISTLQTTSWVNELDELVTGAPNFTWNAWIQLSLDEMFNILEPQFLDS